MQTQDLILVPVLANVPQLFHSEKEEFQPFDVCVGPGNYNQGMSFGRKQANFLLECCVLRLQSQKVNKPEPVAVWQRVGQTPGWENFPVETGREL